MQNKQEEQNIHLVTIDEASEILNKLAPTIRVASSRGVLTRVPVTSPKLMLIKEQVELFIGKNQLKLSALNANQLTLWFEYEQEAKSMSNTINSEDYINLVTAFKNIVRKNEDMEYEKKTSEDLQHTLTKLQQDNPETYIQVLAILAVTFGIVWLIDVIKNIDFNAITNAIKSTLQRHNNKLQPIADKLKDERDKSPYEIVKETIDLVSIDL